MDTVIGIRGGTTLITLFFRRSSLMVALLLAQITQVCVISAFNSIYDDVGKDLFESNISILLT